MKAISSSKYQHLQDAIAELTYVLSGQPEKGHAEIVRQLSEKQEQLKVIFKSYNELLIQLYGLAANYEELAMDIKVNLLGKQLKELRKHLPLESPVYQHVGISVKLLYGT